MTTTIFNKSTNITNYDCSFNIKEAEYLQSPEQRFDKIRCFTYFVMPNSMISRMDGLTLNIEKYRFQC